jgi:hypothetical protein
VVLAGAPDPSVGAVSMPTTNIHTAVKIVTSGVGVVINACLLVAFSVT